MDSEPAIGMRSTCYLSRRGVVYVGLVYAIRMCSCYGRRRGAVYVGCVAAYVINNGL